jgi:cytochrome c biogenesis protein CcdA
MKIKTLAINLLLLIGIGACIYFSTIINELTIVGSFLLIIFILNITGFIKKKILSKTEKSDEELLTELKTNKKIKTFYRSDK